MEFYPIPQPEELDAREKEDASGAYLMMFATTALGLPLPIINMIASIVYYFVNRSKGRFVQFHALQSMYSQLVISAINSYLVIWAIIKLVNNTEFTNVFWGLAIAVGAFNIVYFIFSIIGAVRAHRGRFYYFVFFGRLAFVQVYSKKEKLQEKPVNFPPKM
ncbi:MAG: DUF4870 domain-containing protein [Bacteroidales bacterium]|jgi:uncharacterized Tic20 family protein|nr:DUF4870 domain-containing protein [Bacteroidales bacterium]MDD4384376.1 DUF4870 domain-containing protein [Bacteroidales bacterium]MDY0197745.1 DUF4870 domain-containing protein [Tenuifilaceae bacterium]